jgi:hypothetical protein
MGFLIYRIIGLLTALLGAALIAFILEVFYRTSRQFDQLAFAIGMPLSFLLPAIGALMVAAGVLMFIHAGRRQRSKRPT